ncbi:MAG TPA: hypothetical protein VGM94_08025 [Galbitalea sp.]|jgi:hypothetical protein
MIDQVLLDELWDYGDAEGSAARFATRAADQSFSSAERAELVTQQARALGLQERFDEARALLDSLAESTDGRGHDESDRPPRPHLAIRRSAGELGDRVGGHGREEVDQVAVRVTE